MCGCNHHVRGWAYKKMSPVNPEDTTPPLKKKKTGSMHTTRPEDEGRVFIISFFLSDDSISIYERPTRNTFAGLRPGNLHVRMCICVYIHVYVYSYMFMYIYICIHIYTYTAIILLVSALVICAYVCVFIYTYMYIYIPCMFMHIYIYVYIYMYMHTHIYMYIYIYISYICTPHAHVCHGSFICVM